MGSVIADTYTIEGLLGRGGMGAVFVASHLRLPGKRVAIKVLHPELVDDEIFARFQREAEIASRLGHPNIVTVLDFNITPEGVPYLVLELLEGHTLADRIAEGPMPLGEIVPIVRQLGSALAAAHAEGIVHRDLKPQNIFLVPTNVGGDEVDAAKILDFGISKIRGSMTVQTQAQALLGTPQYMAPEQAKGANDDIDQRTDLFALGVIVYEMLCGAPAFAGTSVAEVVFKVVYEPAPALALRAPGTPPAVIAAVEKAMQKAVGDRFATVSDFVHALTGETLAPRPRRSSIVPARSGGGSTKPGVGGTSRRGPAPPAGLDATAAASSSAALGIAATVGSAPGTAPVPMALGETAAAVGTGPGKPATAISNSIGRAATAPAPERAAPSAPAPAPRSRRGLAIGAAAVTLAAIAVVAVVMTRSGAGTPPTPTGTPVAQVAPLDRRVAAADARRATADAHVAAAPVIDAAPRRPDAGRVVDARGTAPRRDASPPPRPDAAPSGGAVSPDEEQAQDLIQSQSWQRLQLLANKIKNANPTRGQFLWLLAMCGQHKTSKVTADDVKAMAGQPGYRKLKAKCIEAGLAL